MFKILLVEDLADNRELVRDVLQLGEFEAEVLEALNGQMALEVAHREHPDLILMDVSLPQMDGFATTERIKSDDELKDIPVVFLTAHAMEKEQQRALEVGGNGYITKPIEIHEFLDQIQSYLTS